MTGKPALSGKRGTRSSFKEMSHVPRFKTLGFFGDEFPPGNLFPLKIVFSYESSGEELRCFLEVSCEAQTK
jgi:hypothetical protein